MGVGTNLGSVKGTGQQVKAQRSYPPGEAKYILYAHSQGLRKLDIPKNPQVLFKSVVDYEAYCRKIREQSFTLFANETHDEQVAELLSLELSRKLNLRAP